MSLSPRQKELVARHLLAHQAEIAAYLKERRWEELAALVEFANNDAPQSLIPTDPALYQTLRQQITQYRLSGWSCLNLKRLREFAAEQAKSAPATVCEKPNRSAWVRNAVSEKLEREAARPVRPGTALGRKLLAARAEYARSGGRALSLEEVQQEVARRRGER